MRHALAAPHRMTEAVARFIDHLQPQIFTLENVWGYRLSDSWRVIRRALSGYAWAAWHINILMIIVNRYNSIRGP